MNIWSRKIAQNVSYVYIYTFYWKYYPFVQIWHHKKDLIEKREKIRSLNDETCLKLKKQVYLNYKQFIEAAREISQLESEMFKINHILTEQKGIMDNITKLFSEETFQEAEKRSQEFGLEYFVNGKHSSSFNIEVQFPKNRQKVLKYQKTGNLTKK